MAGSNTIQFQIVRRFADAGKTIKIDERLQFRTKDTIISILGVELSSWGEWEDFDSTPVVEVVVT